MIFQGLNMVETNPIHHRITFDDKVVTLEVLTDDRAHHSPPLRSVPSNNETCTITIPYADLTDFDSGGPTALMRGIGRLAVEFLPRLSGDQHEELSASLIEWITYHRRLAFDARS